MFVGVVADNFDECIEQKIFHCEIVVDNERVTAETKQIVANELQRIADAPDLCHLLPKKEE